MAIKLYKSQLEPTARSSNVMDSRQISMSEAGSIGNAMKGMLKAGETLYAKHQQIKSETEVKEKIKEIMIGNENNEGLTSHKLKANNMDDPDKAVSYYANEVKKVQDTNHNFNGLFSKKIFKNWVNKQGTEDLITIKGNSTKLFLEKARSTELDYLTSLSKKVLYGSNDIEKDNAATELKERLATKSAEIFGSAIGDVKKKISRDIAFYGYKNVGAADQAAAIKMAEKDDRLGIEDVQKLKSHFTTANTTSTKLINSELTKMNEMADNGIMPELDLLESYLKTGEALGKNELVFKAQKLKAKIALVGSLNIMTPVQIDNFIKETQANIFKDTDGTSTVLYDQLKTAKNYLAKLRTDLEQDPISAVSKRGTYEIETIDFQEFSGDIKGNFETFKEKMIDRKSQAESIGVVYGVENKYLSEAEATQITSVLSKMDNPEQIRFLSQVLVDGFGSAAPDVFAQLQEKDAFLAHIGGLSIVSEGRENKAIDMAIEGYLLNKNENIDIKISDTDKRMSINKYQDVFPENFETLNNIIGTADNIYAAMYFGTTKYKTGIFDKKMYDKAVEMALGKNENYGGVAEYKNHNVHVPMWLKNNEFTDFVDWLKDNPDMLALSSGTEMRGDNEFGGEFLPGDPVGKYDGKVRSIQIFENGEPFLISVGYGKFKVAMQDHPSDPNGDPKYVIDGNFAKKGNNFFIIDFNKVRSNWESR